MDRKPTYEELEQSVKGLEKGAIQTKLGEEFFALLCLGRGILLPVSLKLFLSKPGPHIIRASSLSTCLNFSSERPLYSLRVRSVISNKVTKSFFTLLIMYKRGYTLAIFPYCLSLAHQGARYLVMGCGAAI